MEELNSISSGSRSVRFESTDYNDWFLVMGNGVLKAGFPNNGNHVFEILPVSSIIIKLRHDGCFLTFDDLGNQESGCNISKSDDDHATQFIMAPNDFEV